MVNKDVAQMQRKWVREEVVVLVSEYFKSKLEIHNFTGVYRTS